MKIGYKGFNENLACMEQKFEIGSTYTKTSVKNPRLCTSDGYHYCNTLGQVFNFYRNTGSNRFCEIEILGDHNDDYEKSITTSFRIIRELSKEEINNIIKKETDKKIAKNFNLEFLKEFQTKYPMTFIGGSTALFLYGIRLERWVHPTSDLDIISPYFILFESENNGTSYSYSHTKKSGNDFDETFQLTISDIAGGVHFIKIDVRIDPKAKYDIIEYDGFKFRVSPLLTIINAKTRYALQGNNKHELDLKEILLKK